jgi:hypothetical protein
MNIFKQFFVSLFSPKDISTFREQKVGKTILYVFLLSLLSVLPSFYYFSSAITNGFHAFQSTVQQDLPPFTIENGELHSDIKAPLTINKEDVTIIFDSTNTITQENISSSDNTIYFLKNELVYSMAGQSQSMPYNMLGSTAITKEDVLSFIQSANSILPVFIPITCGIIYLFSAAGKFIEVSILALIGLLLKNILGKMLTYGQLWRLSAYSITLPTIFFMVMDALKTVVPSGFFIYWFVSIIILVLSLKEIKTETP